LIVVDVQNDFLPGGALGIPHGDAVVDPLNRVIDAWSARALPVYLTRDWHPPGHCSFSAQGGPWPVHCVAGSRGAEFSARLHVPAGAATISKGTERDEEAYSTFHGTDLGSRLRDSGIRRVFIGGLATDYCVRFSGKDALAAGLEVVVLEDAVRAVDTHPGDGALALRELKAAGARLSTTAEVVATMGPGT